MDEQLKNEIKEDGNQAVSVKPKRNILKKILIAASFLAVLIAGIILILGSVVLIAAKRK